LPTYWEKEGQIQSGCDYLITIEVEKMSSIAVSPVQWTQLQDIDDIEPLNDSDADCLKEIRDVLKRHGKLDRLGVALLHSHFDIANDEIMLETTNSKERILVTRPVKESDCKDSRVGTIWMLRDGDVQTMAFCKSYCYQKALTRHTKHHRRVKD
jgi:hypothetical protein